MAWVGRLAGAMLAVTEGRTFLIGELKEPLCFEEAGFDNPGERDIKVQPITPLHRRPASRDDGQDVHDGSGMGLPGDGFSIPLEGGPLAKLLAHFFLIRRNGIVSERLWRLVMESSNITDVAGTQSRQVDAGWLATTPWPVWEAVRDAVLRC